jgi:hypothetical protein
MTIEEEKKTELVQALRRRNETLIAMAVESALDCRLENGVLSLQYMQPTVNKFILDDPQGRSILDDVAKNVGLLVKIESTVAALSG